MIHIMRANPVRDSHDIAKLIQICRSERKTVLNEYTVEEEREYLSNLPPRDSVFVARIKDGLFAGFASINQRYQYSERLKHCGETGTWVMPAFRRQGVGKSLWEKGIFPWCWKHDYKHLGFFIMSDNKEGINFYESLGFHVCGYHRKLVYGHEGTFIDAIEMELWLQN